ncbi:MAG TPA: hypothetical protein VK886_06185 [Vicinamibacterales bacterium]|nr:hypothetical protein [Vicinamibacterales bacterium]
MLSEVALRAHAEPLLAALAAGASLNLEALAAVGVLAGLRLVLIVAGTSMGRRVTNAGPPADLVWMGLVSQAGVTLGLAVLIAREFPDWGQPIQTLVVARSALHAPQRLALLQLFPHALPGLGGALPRFPRALDRDERVGEHLLGFVERLPDLQARALRFGEDGESAVVLPDGVAVFDELVPVLAVLEQRRLLLAKRFVALAERLVRVDQRGAP